MLPSASIALLATNAVFMFLAALSVVIRCYVRREKDALGCDDYLIIAALVCPDPCPSIIGSYSNVSSAPHCSPS